MIYSKRNQLTQKTKEWLQTHNASLNVFNVITALDNMGLLNDDTNLDAVVINAARAFVNEDGRGDPPAKYQALKDALAKRDALK